MVVKLSETSASAPPHSEKTEYKAKTKKLLDRLGHLQHLLYASRSHSALVLLQGMDASGKDGAIRRVFSHCNISGTHAVAFAKPTEEEFAHDFLWRVHQQVPRRGHMTIFNRSHYEDILVPAVHKLLSPARIAQRMNSINAFEQLLVAENNTVIFKFFMHISKAEQEAQLKERYEDETKYWKHNEQDWSDRKHWNSFQRTYEYILNKSVIPWIICPVDDRWYRDYVIASTLVAGLESLKLRFPKPVKPIIKSRIASSR